MADSNAPEYKDGGLFGKKDEEKQEDEYMQQQSHTVDPYATHAPAYNGGVQHAPPPAVSQQPQRYDREEGGEVQHTPLPVSHHPHCYGQGESRNTQREHQLYEQGDGGNRQHQPQRYGQEEGANRQYEQRYGFGYSGNRQHQQRYGFGEGGNRQHEQRLGLGEGANRQYDGTTTKEEPQKKGLMEKIKEMLPGRKQGQTQL